MPSRDVRRPTSLLRRRVWQRCGRLSLSVVCRRLGGWGWIDEPESEIWPFGIYKILYHFEALRLYFTIIFFANTPSIVQYIAYCSILPVIIAPAPAIHIRRKTSQTSFDFFFFPSLPQPQLDLNQHTLTFGGVFCFLEVGSWMGRGVRKKILSTRTEKGALLLYCAYYCAITMNPLPDPDPLSLYYCL